MDSPQPSTAPRGAPWRPATLGLVLALGVAPGFLRATDIAPGGPVVINEIQYNPAAELGDDDLYEYVELHNRSPDAVDVSGWLLKDGNDVNTFDMPDGASIPAGGYLVVARNAAALRVIYGNGVNLVGDMFFGLDNGGGAVRLLNTAGELVDRVEYDDDLPWPSAADGQGSTLERISASNDITDFTNFAASVLASPPGTPGAPNSRAGEIPGRHDVIWNEIMFHPVKDPDADSLQHCVADEFLEIHNRGPAPIDVSGWRIAQAVTFVFPEGTVLAAGGYLVIYADRAAFVESHGEVAGAIGPFTDDLDNGGESLLLVDAGGLPVDHVDYNDAPPWPVNPDGLRGSLELVDPFGDNDRAQAWRESEHFLGTPGARNSATIRLDGTGNRAPPQITSLMARPVAALERREILSTDEVEVSARVLDRDGVAGVRLEYQVVRPGDYISKLDPRFETEWTSVDMALDARSGAYKAVLDAEPHRTLVRYRVHATDAAANAAETWAPYQQDPEPNLAYYVYDGVPDYVASRRAGFGPLGFTHTNLEKVPVYHIIMDRDDLDEVMYVVRPADDNTYSWLVTFVHDNQVYDHCGVRLRGSDNSRYSSPKRSWKLRFNKGNRFRGRFNDGTPYPHRRARLNLNRGVSGGLVEYLSYRLHHDSGVLSPRATAVHVRMVTSEDEHEQFDGDFFGLFSEVQSIDTVLLRDAGRSLSEAASLYKMKGYPNKKHDDCDPSVAEYDEFYNGSISAPDRAWVKANVNLEQYFSFRAAIELTNNHDMDSEKNRGYYLDETGLWELLPWDVECSFRENPCSGEEPLAPRVPQLFDIEYRNRYRAVWQIQFNEDRMLAMFDSMTSLIREIANADVDRWAREPRLACPSCSDGPYSVARFDDRVSWIKDFIHNRVSISTREFWDDGVPRTPGNSFPADGMRPAPPVRLSTLPFVDPQGDGHAATRWLVIERAGDWAHPLWEATTEPGDVVVPAEVTTPGLEYFFRAAHLDSSGRWSYFSEPTSFRVGPPDTTPPSVPGGLELLHATSRSVTLAWQPSTDVHTGVAGYRLLRDGAPVGGELIRETLHRDLSGLAPGEHEYRVIAVNGAGLESAPSAALRVTIPRAAIGGWELPPGGAAYLYDARPGEDYFHDTESHPNPTPTYLDGRWTRAPLSQWDGSRPGQKGSAPGGAAVDLVEDAGDDLGGASVLSLEDAGDPAGFPLPNNRSLYFLHDLGPESVLEQGITLIARLRVHPSPLDLPAPTSQAPTAPDLRGQIGVGYGGRDAPRGHFALWLDDGALHTIGGHSVAVETMEFQSLWLTLAPEDTGHRLRLYLDGNGEPAIDALVDLPTRGVETRSRSSYLEMGLSNRDAAGAVQIDYFGYLRGVVEPVPAGGEEARFIRGDADRNGEVNASDAILTLNWFFRDIGEVDCRDAADTDDSGRINLNDPVRTLLHLFRGGAPPAAPFPGCGVDASADALGECRARACP